MFLIPEFPSSVAKLKIDLDGSMFQIKVVQRDSVFLCGSKEHSYT